MTEKTSCNEHALKDLLADQLPPDRIESLSDHIENCESCNTRLESLAAGPDDWSRASKYLVDSGDILAPSAIPLSQTTIEVQLDPTYSSRPLPVTESTSVTSMATQLLDPPRHPEMLGRIDDFEIEKVIGQGGMGIVYKGFDNELNRPVAIKVLAPHLAASGIARQRFAREAKAAAAVVHPNVVPIHSVSSSDVRPYIVMTLVAGRSLEAHVQEHGPLDVKDIVRIAKQIAAGLSAAHRQGLVHRDIKPANILMEQDVSRVMISDFGLARAADDAAITQTGWLAGTPHYMSPEQAQGAEIDARSDLFSLGSVMYFMATGREPFRAEKPFAIIQQIIAQQPMGIRRINSDVPATLNSIICKLLEKKPAHRFHTAKETHDSLEHYLAYLQSPETAPKPKNIRTRNERKSRLLLFSLVALLVFTGGLFWTANNGFFSNSPPPNNDQNAPLAMDPQDLSFEEFDRELGQLSTDISQLEFSIHSDTPFDSVSNNHPGVQTLDAFRWPDDFNRELIEIENLTRQFESGDPFNQPVPTPIPQPNQDQQKPLLNERGNHEKF